MAKPRLTAAEAMREVETLAKQGFIIQQLTEYHFRIPFRHDLFVDWWPTTDKARVITGEGGWPIFHAARHELEPYLQGLYYAVHGSKPQPVVYTRQQEQNRVEPEKQRNRTRRPVSEGGPRPTDVCDKSSAPWDD